VLYEIPSAPTDDRPLWQQDTQTGEWEPLVRVYDKPPHHSRLLGYRRVNVSGGWSSWLELLGDGPVTDEDPAADPLPSEEPTPVPFRLNRTPARILAVHLAKASRDLRKESWADLANTGLAGLLGELVGCADLAADRLTELSDIERRLESREDREIEEIASVLRWVRTGSAE
jgi:hypothetical protein